jgi:hypothetical protein
VALPLSFLPSFRPSNKGGIPSIQGYDTSTATLQGNIPRLGREKKQEGSKEVFGPCLVVVGALSWGKEEGCMVYEQISPMERRREGLFAITF